MALRFVRGMAFVMVCSGLAFAVATRAQTHATAPPNSPRPAQASGPDQPPPSRPARVVDPARRDIARLFADNCANCHGPTLAGNLAPTLLDETWTFGGDDASLMQTIREGRPGTAMVGFKATLSDSEIRGLVIFIREAGERARASGEKLFSGPADAKFPPADTVFKTELASFTFQTIAEGLDAPWGIDWLPDGRMIVSERPGRLRIIDHDKLQAAPIAGAPSPVWVKQDGGYFDVIVHPKFAANHFIYLAYSIEGKTPGTSATRVVRARLDGNQLVDITPLFEPSPAQFWDDNRHYGARFLFDPRGYLFFSIGDRGHDTDAQDLSSPYGKLHRVNDDGSVPKDNPFVNRAGAVASIWSYGNRNQQGLAINPKTGDLWASEHGPRGGDELNIIAPGKNYGWPLVTFGMADNGTPITDKTEAPGMESPIVHWTPSIAVEALDFYSGDRYPAWKGDLFVTALARMEMRRLRIDGRKVVSQEVLFSNIGRVRDVATGPDGYLYVAFNQPGRIVRLVPAPTGASATTHGNK